MISQLKKRFKLRDMNKPRSSNLDSAERSEFSTGSDFSKYSEHSRNAETQLPPFFSLQAALMTRLRTWRTLFFASSVVMLIVIIGQQKIIFHKLFQKMNEQVIIVPGSPEFFRVRPGQIPKESVFIFAEFVANHLGNFNHRNVAYHFAKMSQYMHPALKGKFESEFQPRLKEWSERQVDQTFSYEPVSQFDLRNDSQGSLYVAWVEGTRVQYVEGQKFSESKNVLLLEFRPLGNLTPEKSFLFQIENLQWLSPSQFEVIKNTRELGQIKENEK